MKNLGSTAVKQCRNKYVVIGITTALTMAHLQNLKCISFIINNNNLLYICADDYALLWYCMQQSILDSNQVKFFLRNLHLLRFTPPMTLLGQYLVMKTWATTRRDKAKPQQGAANSCSVGVWVYPHKHQHTPTHTHTPLRPFLHDVPFCWGVKLTSYFCLYSSTFYFYAFVPSCFEILVIMLFQLCIIFFLPWNTKWNVFQQIGW